MSSRRVKLADACLGLAAGILAASFSLPARLPAQTAAQNSSEPAKKPICCATQDDVAKLYLSMPAAKKRTPRTADGHPDLSGFWDNLFNASAATKADGSVDFELVGKSGQSVYAWPEPDQPPYKPEYYEKVKKIVDGMYGNTSPKDPELDCKPMGVPRATAVPLQIVQSAKTTAILYESDNIAETYRVIYTDGRPHPKDLDTSYLGDSIGHWEGDTLVVDVTGLNDETWLGGADGHTEPAPPGENRGHQIVEKYAMLHSDQEHVVERYTRHGDMLIYNATVEDPVMLTKPWVLNPRYMMLGGPDDRIFESTCVARDKQHLVKPTP